MYNRCDPKVEWWQGSLFYEIFPASFQDSYKYDGIGDLPGITQRLDYLENLGVKGVRLNSIFLSSKRYPEDYEDVKSLTIIDPVLGDLNDFSKMIDAIHRKNMALILDLPIYSFVKNFNVNETINEDRYKREVDVSGSSLPSRREIMDSLSTLGVDSSPRTVTPSSLHPFEDNEVTKAIRFWNDKKVDGFYLKGLEHYVNEANFNAIVKYWRLIVGHDKIFMCSDKVFNIDGIVDPVKNVILNEINLIDVGLNVVNGTKSIKHQVMSVLKGTLFQKAGYPWVHWSTGSVDTQRLAGTLKVSNATLAVAMLTMMLPGTPSLFYGNEVKLYTFYLCKRILIINAVYIFISSIFFHILNLLLLLRLEFSIKFPNH